MTPPVPQPQHDAQPQGDGGVPPCRRRWWARVPGLRVFAAPVLDTTATATTATTATATTATATAAAGDAVGEVVPYPAPGSRLRVSSRAAGKGFYAPAVAGVPSTTRQAEILQLALIATPTGSEGVVNGRDVLSRALVAHDAPTAYNQVPREITSPNVLSLGTVGAGKSSFVKTVLVARAVVLRGRNAVVFDKKPSDDLPDEGEYAPLARALGSSPVRFTADGTGTRLNILDPVIAAGAGMSGQYALLAAVARVARDDAALDGWEKKALRAALARTLAAGEDARAPVAADLLPYLGAVADDPEFRGLHLCARDRLHEAGLGLRWTFDELVAAYPGLLDGETSSTVDLSHTLTVFDLSQLPDAGPAVPVVMAIGNMWLMGRLRRAHATGSRAITNVIYEEGWHLIGGPSAQLVRSNQKLSRSLGISNVFVMHKGTDIPQASPGYAVIQEAQTVYIFRQDRRDDAEWAVATFGLAPETTETLMTLPVGQCVAKIGSRPEIRLEHVRSEWETGITNTDAALATAQARP